MLYTYGASWFLGLGIVIMYVYFAKKSKYLITDISKSNKITLSLILFFLLQLLSTLIASTRTEIPTIRLIGILHNYFVFLFFTLGFSLGSREKQFNTIASQAKKLLIIFAAISVSASLYSNLISKSEISYNTPFGDVYLSFRAFISSGFFSRTSIFADYYNGSAILALALLFLHTSISIKSPEKQNQLTLEKLLPWAACLFVSITTGSRTVTVMLAVFAIFMLYPKAPKKAALISLILGLSASFIILPAVHELINMRGDSNETRFLIYSVSLQHMINDNPFFGIGYKPLTDDFKYPIGSHSTYIGYLVKNGIFIGLIPIMLYLYIFLSTMNSALYSSKKNLQSGSFIKKLMLLIMLSILWLEDLDYIETNALLIGMLFGQLYPEKEGAKNCISTK
ncbi:O-Antigen ligase [compost metagenome]